MLTDQFYRLHQEDAAELLTSHMLNTDVCPRLAPILTTLGAEALRCARCGHPRDPTRTQHHSFQLPIEGENTDGAEAQPLRDVQTALDAYLADEAVTYELA